MIKSRSVIYYHFDLNYEPGLHPPKLSRWFDKLFLSPSINKIG